MNTRFNEQKNMMSNFIAQENYNEAVSTFAKIFSELDMDDDDDLEVIKDIFNKIFIMGNADPFIDFLLENGFNFSADLGGKKTLMILMADTYYNNPDTFDKIKKAGAEINSCDSSGRNILHVYANKNIPPYLKHRCTLPLEIIKKYDISELCVPDFCGAVPMHYAVYQGNNDILSALLEKGADPDITGSAREGRRSHRVNFDGMTPLQLAFREGKFEAAELLLKHGADVRKKDNLGRDACFYAVWLPTGGERFADDQENRVYENKLKILETLTTDECDTADNNGQTPLLYVLSHYWNIYAADYFGAALVDKGTDVNHTDNHGGTPLIYSAGIAGSDTLKKLIASGADINAKDDGGNTALIYAVKNHDGKKAKYLIKKGADVNIANNEGKTPADVAAELGMQEIIELVI